MMRTLGIQLGHHLIRNIRIAEDILHVIIVIQRIDELQKRFSLFLVKRRQCLRLPDHFHAVRITKLFRQARRNLADVLECAGDRMPALVRLRIVGARFDRRFEDGVGRTRRGL